MIPSPTAYGNGKFVPTLSLVHFTAAIEFSKKTVNIENANIAGLFGDYFDEVRLYCCSCIMTSAACLEALINELYLIPGTLHNSIDNFDESFWGRDCMDKLAIEGKPILDKYEKALNLLGKTRLRKDEDVYKKTKALIRYRNYLVHFKPPWEDARRNERLEVSLEGLFDLAPNVDAGADFLSVKCMSAGCANWAMTTTRNFILDFGHRSELFPKKFEKFQL